MAREGTLETEIQYTFTSGAAGRSALAAVLLTLADRARRTGKGHAIPKGGYAPYYMSRKAFSCKKGKGMLKNGALFAWRTRLARPAPKVVRFEALWQLISMATSALGLSPRCDYFPA